MTSDLDVRRRRAAYRAQHRGTKEMDHLLGRYAEAHLPAMDEAQLTLFETLLALPDPDLQNAIMSGDSVGSPAFAVLIEALQRFHGLCDDSDT